MEVENKAAATNVPEEFIEVGTNGSLADESKLKTVSLPVVPLTRFEDAEQRDVSGSSSIARTGGLEAALDRVVSTKHKAAADYSIEDASTITNESQIIDRLTDARERYDRMIAEKRQNSHKMTKESSKKASDFIDEHDLVSLHSEYRVESLVEASKSSPKKTKLSTRKAKAGSSADLLASDEETNVSSIFRSDNTAPTAPTPFVPTIRIIATEKAQENSLASSDSDATPIQVRSKIAEYRSRLQILEKLVQSTGETLNKEQILPTIVAPIEIDPDPFEADTVVAHTTSVEKEDCPVTPVEEGTDPVKAETRTPAPVEDEENDDSDVRVIETVDSDEISWDEDKAALLIEEDEAQKKIKSLFGGVEREETDVFGIKIQIPDCSNVKIPDCAESPECSNVMAGCTDLQVSDCTNLCLWFLNGVELDENMDRLAPPKSESATYESVELLLERDNVDGNNGEMAELTSEDLIAKLSRRMALDAVIPKKKLGKPEHYNNTLFSRDIRMERAVRRAIAAQALNEKLLAGHTIIDSSDDSCPCEKCGNQFLLTKVNGSEGGDKVCVVCPAIETNLVKVINDINLSDPYYKVKRELEEEIRLLQESLDSKTKESVEAIQAEADAIKSKREAEEAQEMHSKNIKEAEVMVNWKSKQLTKIRGSLSSATELSRVSLQEAVKDKAEAKRKAKLGIKLADTACMEASYQHAFSVKATVLAELNIFIAEEAVRKAVEARNATVAHFNDMKKCSAKLKVEVETKNMEKAWAIAGASMLLSNKESDIKAQQSLREEAELKTVELDNKIRLEKEKASQDIQTNKKSLLFSICDTSDAEKALEDAKESQEALEQEANTLREKIEAKIKELGEALNGCGAKLSKERLNLKSTVGKLRADADEQKAWEEQSLSVLKTFETRAVEKDADSETPVTDAEVVNHGAAKAEKEEYIFNLGLGFVADAEVEIFNLGLGFVADVGVGSSEETKEDDDIEAKDAFNFYREVCGMISNRWKHDEAFRQLQMDPFYPYLNSCSEVNCNISSKKISQEKNVPNENMSSEEIALDLQKGAEEARPYLIELCKDLAKSLKISKIGVGPIKDTKAAITKADNKYGGDILKVTDFCRAFVVVEDTATLLALFETLHSTMPSRVKRIKFSSLKKGSKSLSGGYRDCKINLLVQGHICEVQVHLQPMWAVNKVDGYSYYQKSMEFSVDSINDPYKSLNSISEKTLDSLVTFATEALPSVSPNELSWKDEEHILGYFALAGIYLQLNQHADAETILVTLTRLRSENINIGPLHSETLYLKTNLEASLRVQELDVMADVIAEQLAEAERRLAAMADDATASMLEFLGSEEKSSRWLDAREEEKEILNSKKQWLQNRKKLFTDLNECTAADIALILMSADRK